VDRYVGLSREQRSLNLHREDSLAADGREIRLQIAIAARFYEDQFTLNPVSGQSLLHGVRLDEG
jgi:hypothetical protein